MSRSHGFFLVSPRATALQVLILSVALSLAAGCATSINPVGELNETAFFYHRDLRWQRFSQASKHMDPALREAYMDYASQVEGRLDVDSIDIIDVDLNEAKDEATVRVRFSYVLQPSLRVDTLIIKERWKREPSGWQLVSGVWPNAPAQAAP